MKLTLKTKIILQFLVIMLPALALLAWQTYADARRASTLEHSFAAFRVASEARASYKLFVDGVVDGVDSGKVASGALTGLKEAHSKLETLSSTATHDALGGILKRIGSLQEAASKGSDINNILPMRSTVNELTVQIAEVTSAFEKQTSVIVDEATKSSRNQLITVCVAAIATLLTAAFFIRGLIVSLTGPLQRSIQVADAIAKGDLTSRIDSHGTDETGQLLRALQAMNVSLVRIVQQVRATTDEITNSSAKIASGSAALSTRSQEQAASLEETAAAARELTETVQQNADNAMRADQLATGASQVAQRGGKVVADVVSTMTSIDESSRRIVDIIGVIDGIAFQTNILALNAAVEAARAGDQGRGFAVVAAEVRNLAQRSGQAAGEIKKLIEDSVQKVNEGNKLVDQAGKTMQEIVTAVQSVSEIMTQITNASREQGTGVSQVSAAVEQMDAGTQESAAAISRTAAEAAGMQDQAHNLSEAVSVFRLPPDAS